MGWWRKALGAVVGRSRLPDPLPTADYYFLGGIGDLVGGGETASGQPIVRLGPNTWAHAGRLVIIRYVTPDEISAIESGAWQSVHYVIDDLIPAAADSLELPADYRSRLTRFSADLLPRILALRPAIVAPSAAILEAFPGFEHERLDPCCLALRRGLLPPPTPAAETLDIAFLGTRSHAGTLPLLKAIGEALNRLQPDARLHLFFGRHLPPEIASMRAVIGHAPVPWPQFQEFTRRSRFHIGLAPVLDTPFATARSITKLMDYAAVGAAGLYGRRAPFDGVITDGRDGLLLGDDPGEWVDAILKLAADPARRMALAREGAALAARLGHPSLVRRFWIDALAIDLALT